MPVIKGYKIKKEKFASADYTMDIVAYISASKHGIQAATVNHSRHEIKFETPEECEKQYVYQNSWNLTTRTISIPAKIHGGNQGLVLPPRVAFYQVIIL